MGRSSQSCVLMGQCFGLQGYPPSFWLAMLAYSNCLSELTQAAGQGGCQRALLVVCSLNFMQMCRSLRFQNFPRLATHSQRHVLQWPTGPLLKFSTTYLFIVCFASIFHYAGSRDYQSSLLKMAQSPDCNTNCNCNCVTVATSIYPWHLQSNGTGEWILSFSHFLLIFWPARILKIC